MGRMAATPSRAPRLLVPSRTMQAEDLCGRAREIEAVFMPRLRELAEKFEVIGDIRGRGAMLAIELAVGER